MFDAKGLGELSHLLVRVGAGVAPGLRRLDTLGRERGKAQMPAMAVARVWPARVTASDIDPLAASTARANVAANRLGGRVVCITAPGFAHPLLHRGP